MRGRRAATDGAGEERVAGDEDRAGEAVDVIAERRVGVAGQIASADGERAAADGVAGAHGPGVFDLIAVNDVASRDESRNAADVVAVGVGDENMAVSGRADRIERDRA